MSPQEAKEFLSANVKATRILISVGMGVDDAVKIVTDAIDVLLQENQRLENENGQLKLQSVKLGNE